MSMPAVDHQSRTAIRPGLENYVRQHLADVESLPTYRPVVACIIPAYNEAESIESVLRSLLKQPDCRTRSTSS